ncbi:MAG: hypothetical protein IPN76_11795 [Saprospiraceae bacterium]|nr:hypothetical protein [Saprospiraceae bacterium]
MHQFFCQRQPDARAARLGFFQVVGLKKAVENVRNVFGWYAAARVGDG